MKKTISKTVNFCDKCNKEEEWLTACLGCGVEMCGKCQDKHGVEYSHAVHCSGSGDGFYCNPCDVKFTHSEVGNNRHDAYRQVKALRDELAVFQEDFNKRKVLWENAVRKFNK